MVSTYNGSTASSGLLVVVSQGQSRSPEKRALEDSIATIAASLPNTTSLIVPHLYDLASDSQSVKKMGEWTGPIVILSWLFDRAGFWVLDRHEIRGQHGEVLLLNLDLVSDDDEEEEDKEDEKAADRVANIAVRPLRNIYSIDMRAGSSGEVFAAEFRRILSVEQLDAP